jgi:CRP-like cAMP-binding protein
MTLFEEALDPGTPVRSDKGIVIYVAGTPAEKIYLVKSGSVLTQRFDDAGESIVRVHGPGEYFGELALRSGSTYAETARILGRRTEIVFWLGDVVRDYATFDPIFSNCIARMLLEKIEDRDRQLRMVHLKFVRFRIAAVLTDLADRIGRPGGNDEEVIVDDITHNCLSEMVGTSRELVTSSISFFRREKYVRTPGHGKIIILKRADLRNFSWHRAGRRAASV